MNKLTNLLIALSILNSTSAFSSESNYSTSQHSSQTSLNITGGLGFSSIESKDPIMSSFGSTRNALNLSVMLDMPLSESVSILTGPNYIQKGSVFSFSSTFMGNTFGMSSSIILDYIELPILLQGKLNLGDSTLALGAGPFAALCLSKKIETMSSITNSSTTNQLSKENVSTLDYGVRLGLNFDSPISNNFSFLVGANYDWGLKNINNLTNDSIKTRSFLANVGLGIKI